MSWTGFAVALLVTFLLQAGVAAPLDLPNFDAFLVLALVCGLLAPTHEARIAAWTVGLAQDLGSVDALGIHAFALGLSALLLTHMRGIGNVSVWWVAALTTFVAAWPGQLIYLLHLHYWASGSSSATFGSLIVTATLTSLVAAALATLINALPWATHRRRRRFRSIRV